MEIKVSTTSAKAAKVTIGLDVKSAEVLKEFLMVAKDNSNTIEIIADDAEVITVCEVTEIICGIINGLDGEDA